MNVHDFFKFEIIPDIHLLLRADSVEKSKFELFLDIIKKCGKNNFDARTMITDTVFDLYKDDENKIEIHQKLKDAFDLLICDDECKLEKITYLDGIDRISVEYEVRKPE